MDTLDTFEIARPVRRLTVAIGLFDGPFAVQSALRDLANHGFGFDRIRVFTSAEAGSCDRLSGNLARAAGAAEAAGVPAGAAAYRPVAVETGSDAITCIRDIVRQALTASANAIAGPAASGAPAGPAQRDGVDETPTIWGLERQASSLRQHLSGGGSVLIVRIESADEQRAVCSMLLHYADRGVQTHQLRYGRPASEMVGHSLHS
jgi:hypothetical protein